MVPLGPLRLGLRQLYWFPWALFLRFFSEGDFLDFLWFGEDLGRFLEAKIEAQIDFSEGFWGCFFRLRFGNVLASILDGFWEAPTPFCIVKTNTKRMSAQNRRFQEKVKKSSILATFLEAKATKNR